MISGCYWDSFPTLFLASGFFSEIVLWARSNFLFRMGKLQLLLCYSRPLTYIIQICQGLSFGILLQLIYMAYISQSTQQQIWYHLVDGTHCLKLSKIQVIVKFFVQCQMLCDTKDKCCLSSWNLRFISVSNVSVSFALRCKHVI